VVDLHPRRGRRPPPGPPARPGPGHGRHHPLSLPDPARR
jgi:hypothetical protein